MARSEALAADQWAMNPEMSRLGMEELLPEKQFGRNYVQSQVIHINELDKQ